MELLNFLQALRKHNTTDPKDKVYAVVALASDGIGSPGLQPDYTKSLAQVYTVSHHTPWVRIENEASSSMR